MKITSIKYNSKENVFNLIIDDNEKYNLSYDLYESYKLFEEMTIDDDLYLIIKKYHIFYNAKKQTLKFKPFGTVPIILKLLSLAIPFSSI